MTDNQKPDVYDIVVDTGDGIYHTAEVVHFQQTGSKRMIQVRFGDQKADDVRKDAEQCICKGNLRLILKETEELIGRKYQCGKGKIWKFIGVLHGDDDYYYCMYRDGETVCLSCVGNIEGFGFTLMPDQAIDKARE